MLSSGGHHSARSRSTVARRAVDRPGDRRRRHRENPCQSSRPGTGGRLPTRFEARSGHRFLRVRRSVEPGQRKEASTGSADRDDAREHQRACSTRHARLPLYERDEHLVRAKLAPPKRGSQGRRPGRFDGLMPTQTPEPDQTMAASVWVKSNAPGDFGRLLSTSAMSPLGHSRSDCRSPPRPEADRADQWRTDVARRSLPG